MNTFSLGSQIGGPSVPGRIFDQEQELRNEFNVWRGEYTKVIREFAFVLRVDASIHSYTKMWNIVGAQKAKRKRDWLEVEIGVPESWWRGDEGRLYKWHIANAVDEGLHSMIDLLKRNRHEIDDRSLVQDWQRIRSRFLADNKHETAMPIF
jgi:hypothetical protein